MTCCAGVRQSATFPQKAQAQQWARDRENEAADKRSGVIVHKTVKQALEHYAAHVSPKHKGSEWEKVRLTKLARELTFSGKRLSDVTAADIASWRDNPGSLAPASIRREFGLLRAVFACCKRDWGWLRVSPFESLKPPPEGRPRTRRVSDDELERIIAALGTGPVSSVIGLACRWALETAMRQGEILRLTRDDINGRVATLVDTKNGDVREVPLSKRAIELLEGLPKRDRLFPIDSRSFDTLFRKARKKAGIKDVHFHDLRREATTRLAKKLDVLQLAKMTGHRDIKILLRTYYAPAMEDVAALLD